MEPGQLAEQTAKLVSALGLPALAWLVCPPLYSKILAKKKKAEIIANEEVARWQAERSARASLLDQLVTVEKKELSFQERAILSFKGEVEESQANRESIASLTIDEIANNEIPSDNNLDEEFIKRFYRYASDVNKEEAQRVWARLLAGEICFPGSFSLKTLDLLRNLTKEDAEDIVEANSYVFDGIFPVAIYSSPKHKTLGKLSQKIRRLNHLGLIDGVTNWSTAKVPPFTEREIWTDGGRIVLRSNEPIGFCLRHLFCSNEFYELARLTSEYKPNVQFLSSFISELRLMGFEVTCDINGYTDDHREFDPEQDIAIFENVQMALNVLSDQ